MRFNKKPRYKKILIGVFIVLLSFILVHNTNIHHFWPGVLFGLGVILFTNGFLMTPKEQGRVRVKYQSIKTGVNQNKI